MKEHTPPAPDTPLSVLIVDDEAPARERLRDLLGDIAERHPTRLVGMAANGIEALGLLDTTPADLILTDIRMPAMDGIEMAKAAAARYPGLRILLMTGYADQRERAHGLDALIHDVITKPFSVADIRNAVNGALIARK